MVNRINSSVFVRVELKAAQVELLEVVKSLEQTGELTTLVNWRADTS